MDRVDTIVIGAGVIGLAIARELALIGREVVVLETERQFGSVTSSRNSEVIHAGIYYRQASAKAKTCVEGRSLLYAYCAEHKVEHRRCGKLIVATDDAETRQLEAIRATAHANGVNDVDWIDAEAIEPALRCKAALHSPSTGIVDAHGFMLALLGDAQDAGVMIAYGTAVQSGISRPDHICLKTADGEIGARLVVNAAGLGAPAIAAAIDAMPPAHIPRQFLAKGNYFVLSGKSPFARLVYPVPVAGGLGVHLTVDLAGQARFGPDVEWVDTAGYAVDPERSGAFYAAIRRYWPDLPDGALIPGYAGIRPKLSGPGEPATDFRIDGSDVHGVPGLINLFGIESPGLTASLSLARRVSTLAQAMA